MCTDGGFPGAVKVVMKGKDFLKFLMRCKMTVAENEGGEGV